MENGILNQIKDYNIIRHKEISKKTIVKFLREIFDLTLDSRSDVRDIWVK